MALYTIADLHLSHGKEKPMSIFGHRWQDHTLRIEKSWRALITEADTVVIPGDISWAMTLREATEDFRFIESLPGRKIISKGNHDYWWTTVSKMKKHLSEIGVSSIDFLQNNAFSVDGIGIAGSRGWYIDSKLQETPSPTDYAKIVNRECIRLCTSLREAEKLSDRVAAFLHFPPVFGDFICREIVDVLHAHSIEQCYFGHIHGKYAVDQTTDFEGIKFTMISADFLNFVPQRVFFG